MKILMYKILKTGS